MKTKIVYNNILGGWYVVVRRPNYTQLIGKFDSKAEAKARLQERKAQIRFLS